MTIAAITDAKNELKGVLEDAGLTVSSFVPERLIPPLVIINDGSPWVRLDTLSNSYSLGLQLVCVVATATNQMATEKLEQLVEDVIVALPGFSKFSSADAPYTLETNNAAYLASNINIEIYFSF
jgi:hypothetical protein